MHRNSSWYLRLNIYVKIFLYLQCLIHDSQAINALEKPLLSILHDAGGVGWVEIVFIYLFIKPWPNTSLILHETSY